MSATHESPATNLRLRGVTVALLLGALLLAACSGSPDRPEAGVDPDRLTEQINGYLDSVATFDAVRVILVQSDGEAVVDLYRGADPEDYWDVESVTKSVISILVGIAVDQGHIAGTDQTLAQLLPSHAAQMAPQVAEVTLHQLLTMTAGFSGVFDRSGFIDRTAQEMRAADPVGRILRAASANRAGEFDYSNGGSHLVSAILVEATGMSVLDYARSSLFEPLGISSDPPTNQSAAAQGSMSLRTRCWVCRPDTRGRIWRQVSRGRSTVLETIWVGAFSSSPLPTLPSSVC